MIWTRQTGREVQIRSSDLNSYQPSATPTCHERKNQTSQQITGYVLGKECVQYCALFNGAACIIYILQPCMLLAQGMLPDL
jgi:hypothetical protein